MEHQKIAYTGHELMLHKIKFNDTQIL